MRKLEIEYDDSEISMQQALEAVIIARRTRRNISSHLGKDLAFDDMVAMSTKHVHVTMDIDETRAVVTPRERVTDKICGNCNSPRRVPAADGSGKLKVCEECKL